MIQPKTIMPTQWWLFSGLGVITVLSLAIALLTNQYLLLLAPVAAIFAYIALVDFKKIFFLMLFMLPLATEVEVGSVTLDLPSEPLVVALMFVFFVFLVAKPKMFKLDFFKHPIIILLLVHLLWMAFGILHSENPLVSTKFVLSKIWYYAVFLFLAGAILRYPKNLRRFFWLIFIPLTFTAIQTLIRYGAHGFDFEFVNEPVYPFFRNHVNYAAMLTLFYPFIWLAGTWYEKGTFKKRVINIAKLLYLIAIYLSYTRACYVALLAAAGAYVLINWGVVKQVMIVGIGVAVLSVGWLSQGNNYMVFAPEYTKTVHHKNFADHITATVNLQDVSSMERVYRWIAAFYMVDKRPVVGYGAGNFHPYYKRYTVSEFMTYTSDNEEKSTVHNYFLLTMVEQGFVGLFLFLAVTYMIFVSGQRGYKRARTREQKNIIMACMLSLVAMYVNLMLSDLVEVDKTGSLYFMSIAIMVGVIVSIPKEGEEAAAELDS